MPIFGLSVPLIRIISTLVVGLSVPLWASEMVACFSVSSSDLVTVDCDARMLASTCSNRVAPQRGHIAAARCIAFSAPAAAAVFGKGG